MADVSDLKTEEYVCNSSGVTLDEAAKERQELPGVDHFHDMARLFKVLGDPTRMRILWLLRKRDRCVCEIAEVLEMSQSAVSHQLSVLRASRLVKYRRQGRMVEYSLDDDHVSSLMNQADEHLGE